jgi:hypothetical protein
LAYRWFNLIIINQKGCIGQAADPIFSGAGQANRNSCAFSSNENLVLIQINQTAEAA